MRALAIIPALNEERNLPRVLDALRSSAAGWDICVVDDGSTDGTARVAREHGAMVLRLPQNLGIGGAVQTGYLWARERGYQAAAQIDGDGQHDPHFLAAALAPIESGKADLVVGSRYLGEGGFQSTLMRRVGIRYLCWFLRLRCGARVTDPTSGFRVAGRRAIELFAAHYPSDYPEPESIAVATRSGLSLCEVPVVMQAREHGRSSIGAADSLYYLLKVSLALLILPADRSGWRAEVGP